MLSILRGAVREPTLEKRTLTLFYGSRTPRDLCTVPVFAADPTLRERVRCIAAISDESREHAWDGPRGFIHEVMERTLVERLHDYEFYFCGPPPMTEAMQKMLLLKYRVPSGQMHFDRFF